MAKGLPERFRKTMKAAAHLTGNTKKAHATFNQDEWIEFYISWKAKKKLNQERQMHIVSILQHAIFCPLRNSVSTDILIVLCLQVTA